MIFLLTYQQFDETYLGHTSVNDKIGAVHEATFVTSQKQHGLSLFDRLAESSCREMNFSSMALCSIIAKPILKKRCAIA
jgi:hypothetical protein